MGLKACLEASCVWCSNGQWDGLPYKGSSIWKWPITKSFLTAGRAILEGSFVCWRAGLIAGWKFFWGNKFLQVLGGSLGHLTVAMLHSIFYCLALLIDPFFFSLSSSCGSGGLSCGTGQPLQDQCVCRSSGCVFCRRGRGYRLLPTAGSSSSVIPVFPQPFLGPALKSPASSSTLLSRRFNAVNLLPTWLWRPKQFLGRWASPGQIDAWIRHVEQLIQFQLHDHEN